MCLWSNHSIEFWHCKIRIRVKASFVFNFLFLFFTISGNSQLFYLYFIFALIEFLFQSPALRNPWLNKLKSLQKVCVTFCHSLTQYIIDHVVCFSFVTRLCSFSDFSNSHIGTRHIKEKRFDICIFIFCFRHHIVFF